mgnify:CR=1 FL=1
MISSSKSLPDNRMLLEILETCLIRDFSKLARMANTKLLRTRMRGNSFKSPTRSPSSLRCLSSSKNMKSDLQAHRTTQICFKESSLRITLTSNDLISF